MNSSGIIYYHDWHTSQSKVENRKPAPIQSRSNIRTPERSRWSTVAGLGMVALAVGGILGPLTPRIRLETHYAFIQLASKGQALRGYTATEQHVQTQPVVFSPLKTPDGASIDPINKDFSIVVPKIGINAAVIPSVNPNKPGEYLKALEQGVAHSSLSYFPDQDGTVYLFSHSTSYDWFVKDMNAVFYLLKNLEEKDDIVLFYKGSAYTYTITGKQIVKPTDVSYMAPQAGEKKLILQTCWPPGSTTERLLIFADLVKEENSSI